MFDPATIGAALASAKTILDLAKNANDTHLAIRISSAVADVQGKLIEVQQQALNLQQENDRLRADIERSRSYVQHHSAIWKIRPDGTEDGPYCPACMGEGREMRLVLWERADQSRTFWLTHCPKSHLDPRDKQAKGWMPGSTEQSYRTPKELVLENYFFLPTP